MSDLLEIQAQLGNVLAAMPLKLQRVGEDFLSDNSPPFEGAVASNSLGQFYMSEYGDDGELYWKAVRDTLGTRTEVQAQLGNILSVMPLKLQKVDASFLDDSLPPFEGAMASNSSGQFYVADYNNYGELYWKAIRDTLNTQKQSPSEIFLKFDLPIGFVSSTISFGRTLEGSTHSVFAQLESPGDASEEMFYLMSTSNITNTQFNLHISHPVISPGFKIHIHARGHDQVDDPVTDNTPKHSEIKVNGETVYVDPYYSTDNFEEWTNFYGTLEEHDCKVFCIKGYYPLYKWSDCAEAASPEGSYHNYTSLVTDPKNGSELWFAMPEGVDQFHGDWPHYPGN